MKINLAVLVLLGILFHSVAGASVEDLYTSTFEGDLTYYGPTSGGNCGIVPRPSWYDDLTFSAALNANQYASDDKCAGCGVCIRGNYLNTGAGTTPPPSTFSIFIIDQCPECSKGDIDINNESGQSVDGRWQIEWQAIDCPVGSGKLQYLFQGSNSWYMKIGVRNHRIAITKLEIQPFNSAFVTPDRTTDNFFEYNTPNSSTFSFPMKVRVTGVNGQVIEDVVPKLVEGDNSELVSGTNSVQFNAYKPDGGSTGSTTKATATTTKASATTTKASATTTKNSGGDGGDDGSDGGSGGCFAASSVVRVMDPAGLVISKTLEEVRAGDLVESVDGQLRRVFSPVYYMAHGSDSRPVRLVEIVTAASSSLKLTPNHLVFLADNLLQQPRLQHARHAREGQFLFALTADDDDNDEQLQEQQAQPVRIVAVKEAWESVRNPLTDNERIVVSGVACSVFVESDSVYSTLTTPVKAFARAFPSLFQEHSWVSLLLDHIVRFTDSVETAVAAWTRPSSII